jgi:pimeloyl-ACP methyl ester carboxylesterase
MTVSSSDIRTFEVTVAGLIFEVDVAGALDQPLVLLLHGFPQTSYAYRHALPALARAGYCAVAPNQRGYSPKARPPELSAYATEYLLADALGLIDVIRPLGGARFHLVGHDWGGQLAWLLATQHPERLRSLSVLSRPHPAAFAAAFKTDAGQSERSRHHRGFDDPNTAARLLADDARRLRRTLGEQAVPEAAITAYVSKLAEPAALDSALHWYRAAKRSPTPVPDVLVPTLYVWGDQDATVGRVAAESTAQHVKAAYRFEVIAGAGHFLTDQVPERVTQLLLEHIRACDV